MGKVIKKALALRYTKSKQCVAAREKVKASIVLPDREASAITKTPEKCGIPRLTSSVVIFLKFLVKVDDDGNS